MIASSLTNAECARNQNNFLYELHANKLVKTAVFMKQSNPLAWEANFPPVYGHTSISFLKHCSGFNEAKIGDMHAALTVASKCIKSSIIIEIKQKYPDAILLPVITNNKLPEALAKIIDMKTYTGVRELETLSRKSLSAMERLLHKPIFSGKIIKGKKYIIVDDIITQGGTVSALRNYVITHGGIVSAIVTLSYSIDSKILVPDEEDIFILINRFSLCTITNTLRNYNIAYNLWELTRAQIKYLLRFKEIEGLINKIEKTQMAISVYKKQESFCIL